MNSDNIRLVIIRHGKSMANILSDPVDPNKSASKEDVLASRNIRDPILSDYGIEAVDWYRPRFYDALKQIGINPKTTVVGSSPLLRARQTAFLLFPKKTRVVFEGLGEEGDFPENTAQCMTYRPPNWELFLHELWQCALRTGSSQFVVVAHGTFIRRIVTALAGIEVRSMYNLSGFALDLRLSHGSLKVIPQSRILSIPFPKEAFEDACHDSVPKILQSLQTLFTSKP